jgi:hypothetical protein
VEYGIKSPFSIIDGIPRLDDVPLSAPLRRKAFLSQAMNSTHLPDIISASFQSINCMVGNIGNSDHSFLITGDRRIRYWDFSMPSKCYVSNGFDTIQRPTFERIDYNQNHRLMLCRQVSATASTEIESSKASWKMLQGTRSMAQCHHDSICDLKFLKNSLISCSRDCTVKSWR